MKIGINATCFNDRPSGAKQRFLGIYYQVMKQMQDSTFVIYQPSDYDLSHFFKDLTNVTFKKTPIPSNGRIKKFLKGKLYWKSALLTENFDLFECLNLPIVKAPTGKTLLTIHDIRDMSSNTKNMKSLLYKFVISHSLKSADHIITVSKSMKEEILKCFPNLGISVIYNGINLLDFQEKSKEDLQGLRQRINLPQNFFLSVGHLEKRKNYLNLIDALLYLRKNNDVYHLVIIGNDNNYKKIINNYIDTKNLKEYVKIYSGLSDEDVRTLYQHCDLFIFPSYYEGFGIPILEAMASKTEILLSNLPVFREITQNKLNYFDPNDFVSIANSIKNSLDSKKKKKNLMAYGEERIKEFEFEKLSKKMKKLYQSIS